jgi:hypothetical protein
MGGRLVMVQFEDPRHEQLALADAADRLGVAPDALDAEYGVVKVADEPDHALWVVRTDEDVARRIAEGSQTTAPESDDSNGATAQVFSDPVIEPFGPPE